MLSTVFAITLTANMAFAQIGYVAGRIVDAEDREPLRGVFIAQAASGILSNDDGEFLLSVSDSNAAIVVSHLGYHSETYPIANVPQKIKLRRQHNLIEAVAVYPIESIIEKTWQRYYAIYWREHAQSRRAKRLKRTAFFYQQSTRSNGQYSEFIEAFITAVNSYGITDLQLKQSRYGLCRDLKGAEPVRITNHFATSQIRPFHHAIPPEGVVNVFLQPNTSELYDAAVVQVISDDRGEKIFVIDFTPKPHAEGLEILAGQLYIRQRDYAVLKMTASFNQKFNAKRGRFVTDSSTAEVNYIEGIEDYPVVGSVRCSVTGNAFDGDLRIPFEVSSTMLYVGQLDWINNRGRKLNRKNILLREAMSQRYDPEFWRNNPVIKRTPNEESIVKWLDENNVFGTFNPTK